MLSNKIYKKMFQARLETIKSYTGENYFLDYQSIYGGWRIYLMEGSTMVTGQFGNYLRYSSIEMLRYLQGIVDGLTAKRERL